MLVPLRAGIRRPDEVPQGGFARLLIGGKRRGNVVGVAFQAARECDRNLPSPGACPSRWRKCAVCKASPTSTRLPTTSAGSRLSELPAKSICWRSKPRPPTYRRTRARKNPAPLPRPSHQDHTGRRSLIGFDDKGAHAGRVTMVMRIEDTVRRFDESVGERIEAFLRAIPGEPVGAESTLVRNPLPCSCAEANWRHRLRRSGRPLRIYQQRGHCIDKAAGIPTALARA